MIASFHRCHYPHFPALAAICISFLWDKRLRQTTHSATRSSRDSGIKSDHFSEAAFLAPMMTAKQTIPIPVGQCSSSPVRARPRLRGLSCKGGQARLSIGCMFPKLGKVVDVQKNHSQVSTCVIMVYFSTMRAENRRDPACCRLPERLINESVVFSIANYLL